MTPDTTRDTPATPGAPGGPGRDAPAGTLPRPGETPVRTTWPAGAASAPEAVQPDRPGGAASTGGTAAQARLVAHNLRSGYGRRVVVHDVDVTVPSGRITVIVGANACGKSTLLKTMARILAPMAGTVLLDGRSISSVPTRRLATRLGLLPQQPVAPEGIAVADLVGRGRHPHQPVLSLRLSSTSATDRRIVEESLVATRTADLADRSVDELSGGQRQRVWIAMALAQRTDVLLLDEPTTFLDLAHQVEVLDLLTDLNRERGTTIVMVLHDINLAARYADHVIAMKEGRVVAVGEPGQVVDAALVSEVLGLDAEVITDPVSGSPLIVPRGRHHVRGRGTAGEASGQDADTGPVLPSGPAAPAGADGLAEPPSPASPSEASTPTGPAGSSGSAGPRGGQ